MTEYTYDDLVTFASTFNRLMLARTLGQTAFEGERDYYETLGYPPEITIDDYVTRYERQDIAARVVDLPAQDTWKKPPQVSEDDDIETQFVKAWEALAGQLRVWSVLARLDKLSGVGRYGVLLIGVRDGGDLSQPVKRGGGKGVLYLRPFSEEKASILTWEDDAANERYGLPLTYEVKLREDRPSQRVHWTRLLHVAEGKLDSEVYGLPRLKRVYNRLDDLIKIVGGSAEATWLGMRPGIVFTTKPEYRGPESDDEMEALTDEVRKLAHDMLRMTFLEGYEPKPIGPGEILDPRGPFDVCLSLIAAASGIPQRVLVGSAAGELAAAKEDMKQWAGAIAERQLNYAEPEILRPFIDRLIEFGALPAPAGGQYDVGTLDTDGVRRWPALVEMSDLERAEIVQRRATAAKALTNPLTGEMPITDREQRELLGYPPEPEEPAEEMPPEETEEPPQEETPEEGEPGEMAANVALAAAIENYRSGTIDADQLAEYAIAEWAEALK